MHLGHFLSSHLSTLGQGAGDGQGLGAGHSNFSLFIWTGGQTNASCVGQGAGSGHLITFLHCSTPQALGLGHISYGLGHFLHNPALTFTFGHTQEGHTVGAGTVDFNT